LKEERLDPSVDVKPFGIKIRPSLCASCLEFLAAVVKYLEFLFFFLLIFSLVFIITQGFQWMSAGYDTQQ